MKRSLKWLAALCASVMLLGAVLPSALAAPAEASVSYQEYIMSQLRNAIPQGDGTVFVPGYGIITEEEYKELYNKYLMLLILSGSDYPLGGYPGYYPGPYPGFDPLLPNIQQVNMTIEQFESISLYGPDYTYGSTDESVATVDKYGIVTALAPGRTVITVNRGWYTYILVDLTVTEVELSPSNFQMNLLVSDSSLQVGESASITAYVTKFNTYPWLQEGFVQGNITLTVSDTSVVTLNGNTITAVGTGIATLTATLDDTAITASQDIRVYDNSIIMPGTPIYPGHPNYPSYPSYPNYPNYPNYPIYPNYPFYPGYYVCPGASVCPGCPFCLGSDFPWIDYPWYDYPYYEYPWFGYPWFGDTEVSVPNNYPATNWANILKIDTDVYDFEQKFTHTPKGWLRTFILIPKDGTEVESYETKYKYQYFKGNYELIAIQVPVGYTAPSAPVVPENPTLSKEELEALAKAEAEAKKQAELKEKIGLAMEGKLEWYQVYSDLYGDSYYTEAVYFALQNQYVTGGTDGKFGTSKAMTYQDVADLLCKYLRLTPEELADKKLIPVDDLSDKVTREEITVVLYNTAKDLGLNMSAWADVSDTKDYKELDEEYRAAFAWAVGSGVMNRWSETIKPNTVVDKARLCQILFELDKLVNP